MAAECELDTSQVDAYVRHLAKANALVAVRAAALVKHHGTLLQARTKGKAAGRPGPRMVTGDYNRSIGVNFGFEAGSPTARVGTNRPQGRRLEKGFVGTDSLGRTYNQPPYPHFGPALDEEGKAFETAVSELGGELLE